jgi:uncharacterized membrane protein
MYGGDTCPSAPTTVLTTENPITSEYTTSINYTTTIGCQPGEVAGGLPSGPMCYMPIKQALVNGEASVVDLSGNPASDLIAGTAAVTGNDGSVLKTDPGFIMRVGPDSAVSILNVVGDPSSGYSLSQDSNSYVTEDQQGQAMLNSIRDAFKEAKEIAESSNPFSRAMATLKTMTEIKKGILELAGSDLRNIGYVVTQSAGIKPSGDPSFAVNVTNDGTGIWVTNGTVLVASLYSNSTPNYVILGAGQALFIPSNRTQAEQQDLNGSIMSFQNSPTTIQQNNNGQGTSEVGGVITFIIIVLVLLAVYSIISKRPAKKVQPSAPKKADSEPAAKTEKQDKEYIKELKGRYARGEIPEKDYLRMKEDLER